MKTNVVEAIRNIIKYLPDFKEDKEASLQQMLHNYERYQKEYLQKRFVFETIVNHLSNEDVQMIVSVMHLGRGDFKTVSEAFEYNKPNADRREMAISYMLAKSPLKEYLRRGLQKVSA